MYIRTKKCGPCQQRSLQSCCRKRERCQLNFLFMHIFWGNLSLVIIVKLYDWYLFFIWLLREDNSKTDRDRQRMSCRYGENSEGNFETARIFITLCCSDLVPNGWSYVPFATSRTIAPWIRCSSFHYVWSNELDQERATLQETNLSSTSKRYILKWMLHLYLHSPSLNDWIVCYKLLLS